METTMKKFGTAPVFFTAVSTILGAILFLRFAYAVGTVGFFGALSLILLGHMVTIPTALALSEIATNKRVEGGGEYFIVSRSFGLNIGTTIGITLYLSQAISVAFYVIAFTETFQFFFDYLKETYQLILPRQAVSLPVMAVLSVFIMRKGAKLGVKALYVVVVILAISLLLFFVGKPLAGIQQGSPFSNLEFRNSGDFFLVLAIIFPAFTGMTAGVGLSGDLRNPAKSIPMGTVAATFIGMIVYGFISYKLAVSAAATDLVQDQFVMSRIAVLGWLVIPLGLAASTLSSALGSIMVAPRTIQALANDHSFPVAGINQWLSRARSSDDEPFNASLLTCMIAFVFVGLGSVNVVAQIITMFFLITYGSLCLISFLNHFGSSPSYRPSFKSKWVISLIGFLTAVWVMFKINTTYSLVAFGLMILLHIYINAIHKDRKGISSVFMNTIFQVNRNLQLFLQKGKIVKTTTDWRPSVICLSRHSFLRDHAFRLTNWISFKYGFGTYLHHIVGYYSKNTHDQAVQELSQLIRNYGDVSHVYIDTLICPSFTAAIAQSIQIPSISGMDYNMMILEYDKENPSGLDEIIENYKLIHTAGFDICILASSRRPLIYKNGIHVWITTEDTENANLMIILSFIFLGHPDWKHSDIRIFHVCRENEQIEVSRQMRELIENGRLPITAQNIRILVRNHDRSVKSIINEHSADAGLTILGFHGSTIRHMEQLFFEGYDAPGTILFVNACKSKVID
ncbi:MAG TPA: amino acid permease [Bacteroidales bacterium]|nr:amino acid permease [Bacteroidales bacterium]HSA43619.1 amino acid permease [Bacteroidales bacterium]